MCCWRSLGGPAGCLVQSEVSSIVGHVLIWSARGAGVKTREPRAAGPSMSERPDTASTCGGCSGQRCPPPGSHRRVARPDRGHRETNHAAGRRVKPPSGRLLRCATAVPVTRRPPAWCSAIVTERRRPALETDRSPTTSSNRSLPRPPTNTPASNRPGTEPCSVQTRRHRRTRIGRGEQLWHHQQGGDRIRCSRTDSESKSRATDPDREATVTVIDGNQRGARVRESGRGMGVEVIERGHDDDSEQDERCDQPGHAITTRQGQNLHPRCRTGGVSGPRVSIYTPSHTSSHTPVSDKPFHINQIPTQHTTPRCRRLVQGGSRGATHRKTAVLRTRQVFLRHTCRAGSLPSRRCPCGKASRRPALAATQQVGEPAAHA